MNLTDPTGLYICTDSKDCSSDKDKAFEAARQQNLKSNDPDVVRAAQAYGDPNKSNGVNVGFADLTKKGEGGVTNSHLAADEKGNMRAESNVTISSKLSGTDLAAAVGHEGSHVADAQDVVRSISSSDGWRSYKVGQDITQYQSEQRAYKVTDSILRSSNESGHFYCGANDCVLGRGLQMRSQLPGVVDRILASSPIYVSNGRPLSPTNPGSNVVNGLVVPH